MVPGSCSKVREVVGLLVLLSSLSYAARVETPCDGRQNETHCYGPVGGTVLIQLMDSSSKIPNYEVKHKSLKILKVKNSEAFFESHQRKYTFIPSNSTFIISNLSMTDSGKYTLETFDEEGRKTEKRTLQLTLEAPVSSVQLVSECLSQGQVNVSCLSKGGGSPVYSWTLDGHKLKDSELLSGNKNENTIILKPNISGLLVCSVTTKVSSLSREKYTSSCEFVNCTFNGVHISQWAFKENNSLCLEPLVDQHIMELWPIIACALGALLIVVIVSIVCAKRKRQNDREEELTYTDPMRTQQEPRETQEYGKVNKRPQQSTVTVCENVGNSVYGNIDDSVYANV